jgi:hypothetical protein
MYCRVKYSEAGCDKENSLLPKLSPLAPQLIVFKYHQGKRWGDACFLRDNLMRKDRCIYSGG